MIIITSESSNRLNICTHTQVVIFYFIGHQFLQSWLLNCDFPSRNSSIKDAFFSTTETDTSALAIVDAITLPMWPNPITPTFKDFFIKSKTLIIKFCHLTSLSHINVK